MKKISLTLTYLGILFGASIQNVLAANLNTLHCPDIDQITVNRQNGNNNQYPWTSKSPPGNWNGQGGANVDNFLQAQITNNGTGITCYYKTDNGLTKKSNTSKNAKGAQVAPPPPSLKYGSVSVTSENCTFVKYPKSSSCQSSVDDCELTCKPKVVTETQCPDPAYLVQHNQTPPGWKWYAGNPPGTTLHIEPYEGIEIRNSSEVICYYTDDNASYQAVRDFPSNSKCYFNISNINSDEQLCSDGINKCKIYCQAP